MIERIPMNDGDIFNGERATHAAALNGRNGHSGLPQSNNKAAAYAGPPKENLDAIKARVAAANEQRRNDSDVKRGKVETDDPNFHTIRAANQAARRAAQPGSLPDK